MIAYVPALIPGEVHLWLAAISNAQLVAEARTYLSRDELARSERFRFEADRARCSVGRGALRALLGRYLGCAPQSLAFDVNRWGKPSLREHDLAFNVAHSGTYVLIGIALPALLGVDIEELRDGSVGDDCTPYFTTAEQELIRAAPNSARRFSASGRARRPASKPPATA